MKKRILLIFALGISFAPAVLAIDTNIRNRDLLKEEEVEKTGEQSAKIILSRMDGAAGCNLRDKNVEPKSVNNLNQRRRNFDIGGSSRAE